MGCCSWISSIQITPFLPGRLSKFWLLTPHAPQRVVDERVTRRGTNRTAGMLYPPARTYSCYMESPHAFPQLWERLTLGKGGN